MNNIDIKESDIHNKIYQMDSEHISKYIFIKTLSVGVCMCKSNTGDDVIIKYAKHNDKTLRKEIALTQLFNNRRYNMPVVKEEPVYKSNQVDKNERQCSRCLLIIKGFMMYMRRFFCKPIAKKTNNTQLSTLSVDTHENNE